MINLIKKPLKFLEKVILLNDSFGYKKGTKGYFADYTIESGFPCVIFIIDDPTIISKHGDHNSNINMKEFSDFVSSCLDFKNIEFNYNVIKPYAEDIISLEQINYQFEEISKIEKDLENKRNDLSHLLKFFN